MISCALSSIDASYLPLYLLYFFKNIWTTFAARCAKVTTAETTAKFLSCRFPTPGLSMVSFPWSYLQIPGPFDWGTFWRTSTNIGMPNDAGSSPKRSKVLHLCKGFTWSETCGKANMHLACTMEVSKLYPEQTLMLGLETTLLKMGKNLSAFADSFSLCMAYSGPFSAL